MFKTRAFAIFALVALVESTPSSRSDRGEGGCEDGVCPKDISVELLQKDMHIKSTLHERGHAEVQKTKAKGRGKIGDKRKGRNDKDRKKAQPVTCADTDVTDSYSGVCGPNGANKGNATACNDNGCYARLCCGEANVPQCVGDPQTWNAGYGGCEDYAIGEYNEGYWDDIDESTDTDSANYGKYAHDVCKEIHDCRPDVKLGKGELLQKDMHSKSTLHEGGHAEVQKTKAKGRGKSDKPRSRGAKR